MLSLASGLDINFDSLSFDTLFPSSLPSFINSTPTNPNNTDISTRDTITLMDFHARSAAQAAASSPHHYIKDAVEEIQAAAASGDPEDIISATYDYVQEKVTFCEDEDLLSRIWGIDKGVELLITPERLLSMPSPMGDCDDFSMLTKALLLAQGVETSFVTIAADRDNPRKWSHVYLMHDDSGIAIDVSHGKYVGWEANGERKTAWLEKNKITGRGRENMIMSNDGLGNGLGNGAEDNYGAGFPSTPTTSSFDFSSLLSPLITAGSKIAIAQYGQPQLAPGTFIRGADGSILTNQPISGGASLFSSTGTGFGSTGLIIGAIVVIGALAMFSKH